MFVKHSNLLLNLDKVHVKLENATLKFYDTFTSRPAYVIKFPSEFLANFAYGRIIHAILLHWGAVDISEHSLEDLIRKKELEEQAHQAEQAEKQA